MLPPASLPAASDASTLVETDIRQAHTLPASFYRSTRAFEHMLQHGFAPSWQFVGHQSDNTLADWIPFTLLPGSLGEPLLLARQSVDQQNPQNDAFRAKGWKCLSNVCTHRGHVMLQEACRGERIRCRYHGRSFDREGCLKNAPGFEHALHFPEPEDHLPELALQNLGGLLFTRLQPNHPQAIPFKTWIQPVLDRMPHSFLELLRPRPDLDIDYPVHAHWGLYCDNYLEGFHIPYVHPALNRMLDFSAYRTECYDNGSLQIGVAKPGELSFEFGEPNVAAYYYFLFPNLMLNFYPWGLSLNLVEPRGLDQCLVRFRTFVARPELLDQAYNIDEVQREDEAVVHAVQRGVQARLYKRGRFSPDLEQGVHQFHRQIAQVLVSLPENEL
jgi:choline monooxygenase